MDPLRESHETGSGIFGKSHGGGDTGEVEAGLFVVV